MPAAGYRRRHPKFPYVVTVETWAEYPRIPDEPAVAALIGTVPPHDTPNR